MNTNVCLHRGPKTRAVYHIVIQASVAEELQQAKGFQSTLQHC